MPVLAEDMVPVLDGIGRFWSRVPSSKSPGVPTRDVYRGSVSTVSFLLIIGMAGSLSSPTSGNVALRDMGRFSPVFFAALSSAFLLLRSSSAKALLILMETMCISRLLALRSQYPDRPPSSFGIYDHRKSTKNSAAAKSDRNENSQMTMVNIMPDRITVCWAGSALILAKKLMIEDVKSWPSISSWAV
jgi:hypothetical protein